ncbi:hypothetical protein LCAZH_2951 [Lacticaseibacillus paracasei]|nr:hypothetical protein LCAZH_2951 [Lacticaseibacillus paracasei]
MIVFQLCAFVTMRRVMYWQHGAVSDLKRWLAGQLLINLGKASATDMKKHLTVFVRSGAF